LLGLLHPLLEPQEAFKRTGRIKNIAAIKNSAFFNIPNPCLFTISLLHSHREYMTAVCCRNPYAPLAFDQATQCLPNSRLVFAFACSDIPSCQISAAGLPFDIHAEVICCMPETHSPMRIDTTAEYRVYPLGMSFTRRTWECMDRPRVIGGQSAFVCANAPQHAIVCICEHKSSVV
jgi:hypothetical protein